MLCPYCKKENIRVLETRESSDSIRRRRECEDCSKRFTTYERVEALNFDVIKKSGKKEVFDKNKLFSGMQIACEKRVEDNILQFAADKIEQALLIYDGVIDTTLIGKLVLNNLKDLDNIAYLRFVSVCNNFKDASQFKKELDKLVKEPTKNEVV